MTARTVTRTMDRAVGRRAGRPAQVALARSRRPVQRRTRLAFAGGVLMAVTLFMAIGAINGQNNLLYALFGFSLGTVLCTGVIGGGSVMGLSVVREPVRDTPVGEPVRLAYRVTNRNRFLPAFGLEIREVSSDGFANTPVACAVVVPPGQTVTACAVGWCDRRGERTLGRIEATTSFPFSLMFKALVFEAPARFVVTPARVELRGDLLRDIRSKSTLGDRGTSRPGHDGGFLGVREYQPGDPLRHVAWRVSARTPNPVVRTLEDLAMPRLKIAVDAPEQDGPASEERAAARARARVWGAGGRGVAVRLLIGDEEHGVRPTAEGLASAARRLAEPFSPRSAPHGAYGEAAVRVGQARGPLELGLDPSMLSAMLRPSAGLESEPSGDLVGARFRGRVGSRVDARAGARLPGPLTEDWHRQRATMDRGTQGGLLRRAARALRRLEWR